MKNTQGSFEYKDYQLDKASGEISFRYGLTTQGKRLDFVEKLTLPRPLPKWEQIPEELLRRCLDSLHLMLGISYWKVYCPPEIVLEQMTLSQRQAQFWNTVFTKGLGEFFYRNQIDFRGLVSFPYANVAVESLSFPRQNRILLPVGGGKDSVVASEMAKDTGLDTTAFTLGSHPIQEKVIKTMKVKSLTVKRDLDQQLLALNEQEDTYNGHVPITAVYHFAGLLVALLYDYKYLVFANEASADYGNVRYLNTTINHQWSKTQEFEILVRDYISNFLTPHVTPFSILRPFYEIRITKIFTNYPQYFPVFSSCNRNFRILKSPKGLWCGRCPKCAFVFSLLAAFLSKDQVLKIFHRNLYDDPDLAETYRELWGEREGKPWDCVGTPEETKVAFYLAGQKGDYQGDCNMTVFEKEVLPGITDPESLRKPLFAVGNKHLIPEEFWKVLTKIDEIK